MTINQIKSIVLEFLIQQGFKSFGPKAQEGDFQIFTRPGTNKITILGRTQAFLVSLQKYAEELKQKLKCDVEFDGETKFRLTNSSWIPEQKKEILPESNAGTNQDTDFNDLKEKIGKKDDLVEKQEQINSLGDQTLEFESRFNIQLNRLEDLLDNFTLFKLSARGLLEKLYDQLKINDVAMYRSSVGFATGTTSGQVTVLSLSREDFIKVGLMSLKSKE